MSIMSENFISYNFLESLIMAIDTNVQVDAKFCRRWISVGKMKELFSLLENDDILVVNRVGNLSVMRDREKRMIGYIDINSENFVSD